MNINKKKMAAPILVTVFLLLYYGLFFGFLIAALEGPWRWVLGILPLATVPVIIAVCVERIKEIRKGEEDDLGQY